MNWVMITLYMTGELHLDAEKTMTFLFGKTQHSKTSLEEHTPHNHLLQLDASRDPSDTPAFVFVSSSSIFTTKCLTFHF